MLVETEADIQFALGSGAQVMSYLFSRGDYLFQSPISWFREKERWNLSPGFDKYDDRFERPVRAECLFCHVNHAEPVKDTLNRFAMPLFPRGMAIGCERCHGPGELHVRERGQLLAIANGVDHTIVNPRHLAPELREAICHQCHLEGEPRILRRGRQTFDFRPGLPLELFWTIFVRPADLTEHGHFVGQVVQLHASRCFTQSKGKLGCTTCHDAHEHAEKNREFAKAAAWWHRAIAVSPWRTDYRVGEARALYLHGKHDAAIAACLEVLKFNPGSVKIRSLLVSSYLETQRKDRAEAEFAIIMKLNPANKEELRRWFDKQTR